jgi:hypothetical protein
VRPPPAPPVAMHACRSRSLSLSLARALSLSCFIPRFVIVLFHRPAAQHACCDVAHEHMHWEPLCPSGHTHERAVLTRLGLPQEREPEALQRLVECAVADVTQEQVTQMRLRILQLVRERS